MLKLWRLLFCLLMLSLPTMAWGEEEKKLKCTADAFPCWLDTISWVEVSIEGELLKKYKSDFERLIRLRLRNDLSMISHEVRKMGLLPSKLTSPEYKRRGNITCFVWTVGDDYPVAAFVECELWGWGLYSIPKYKEFERYESKYLGITDKENAKNFVNDGIRSIITTNCVNFLEAKDGWKKK